MRTTCPSQPQSASVVALRSLQHRMQVRAQIATEHQQQQQQSSRQGSVPPQHGCCHCSHDKEEPRSPTEKVPTGPPPVRKTPPAYTHEDLHRALTRVTTREEVDISKGAYETTSRPVGSGLSGPDGAREVPLRSSPPGRGGCSGGCCSACCDQCATRVRRPRSCHCCHCRKGERDSQKKASRRDKHVDAAAEKEVAPAARSQNSTTPTASSTGESPSFIQTVYRDQAILDRIMQRCRENEKRDQEDEDRRQRQQQQDEEDRKKEEEAKQKQKEAEEAAAKQKEKDEKQQLHIVVHCGQCGGAGSGAAVAPQAAAGVVVPSPAASSLPPPPPAVVVPPPPGITVPPPPPAVAVPAPPGAVVPPPPPSVSVPVPPPPSVAVPLPPPTVSVPAPPATAASAPTPPAVVPPPPPPLVAVPKPPEVAVPLPTPTPAAALPSVPAAAPTDAEQNMLLDRANRYVRGLEEEVKHRTVHYEVVLQQLAEEEARCATLRHDRDALLAFNANLQASLDYTASARAAAAKSSPPAGASDKPAAEEGRGPALPPSVQAVYSSLAPPPPATEPAATSTATQEVMRHLVLSRPAPVGHPSAATPPPSSSAASPPRGAAPHIREYVDSLYAAAQAGSAHLRHLPYQTPFAVQPAAMPAGGVSTPPPPPPPPARPAAGPVRWSSGAAAAPPSAAVSARAVGSASHTDVALQQRRRWELEQLRAEVAHEGHRMEEDTRRWRSYMETQQRQGNLVMKR